MENETVKFLKGNFDTLPDEVILELMKNLSGQDVKALCSASKGLAEFCTKYDIYGNVARRILSADAPLAKTIYNSEDQVSAIQRGMRTSYTISFAGEQLESVTLGLARNTETQRMFSLKGFPPETGTRVWVFGYIDDPRHFAYSHGTAYISLEDIRREYNNTKNRSQFTDDENIMIFIENFDDVENMNNAFEMLVRDGFWNEFYLLEISLP